MHTISPSSALDWDKICDFIENENNRVEIDEILAQSEEYHQKHDGSKSFNISVLDFDDKTIIDAIKRHHPDTISEKIYSWQYGNYFITDLNFIFSKKSYLSPEAIQNYKQGLIEIEIKPTPEKIKSRQKKILLENLLKNKNKMIYLKKSNERHLKLHVRKSAVHDIKKMGYKVEIHESFFKSYDTKTGEFRTYDTYTTRINRDAFIQMCRTGEDVEKGCIIKNGEQVSIKRGRKKRKYTLDMAGKIMTFEGLSEIAAWSGISSVTVKRKFAKCKVGDVISLARGKKIRIERID